VVWFVSICQRGPPRSGLCGRSRLCSTHALLLCSSRSAIIILTGAKNNTHGHCRCMLGEEGDLKGRRSASCKRSDYRIVCRLPMRRIEKPRVGRQAKFDRYVVGARTDSREIGRE
jgi:hypothetical protein